MYTLENDNTSPLCILCMLMPQIVPILTLMLKLVCMWYEEPPPPPPGISMFIEHTIQSSDNNVLLTLSLNPSPLHTQTFI